MMFANKYRPSNLREVLGQEHLINTILNALTNKRLPTSILFYGPKGSGKTSVARILSKILNCYNQDVIVSGASCNKCEACLSFNQGNFVDVLELDAASFTSVDDIRNIIESSSYKPLKGKVKVYIIDEIHMLSKSAFNALLKVLEIPFQKAYFIFATTEYHKIPSNVTSRCMKFSFKRINKDIIVNCLTNVANKENIFLEVDASKLISKMSEGSIRDALFYLEQASILLNNKVTFNKLKNLFNYLDKKSLIDILINLIQGKSINVLLELNDCWKMDIDPIQLYNDILELIYLTIIIKTSSKSLEMDLLIDRDRDFFLEKEELNRVKYICENVDISVLIQFWTILSKGRTELLKSNFIHQTLEMIFIRLTYISPFPNIHDLILKTYNNNLTDNEEDKKKNIDGLLSKEKHKNILQEEDINNINNNSERSYTAEELLLLVRQEGSIELYNSIKNEFCILKCERYKLLLKPLLNFSSLKYEKLLIELKILLKKITSHDWFVEILEVTLKMPDPNFTLDLEYFNKKNINKHNTLINQNNIEVLFKENDNAKESVTENKDRIAEETIIQKFLKEFPGSKLI